MKPSPALVLVAALLVPAWPAQAEMIYKYQRPDGSLVYSDEPVRGAQLLDRFAVAQTTPAPREDPGVRAPSARPPSALDQASAEVSAAEQAVGEAKARLQNGAEPQAGERVGIGGGKSRLTEDYFARQKQLEQNLAEANRRLELAYEHRNEAK